MIRGCSVSPKKHDHLKKKKVSLISWQNIPKYECKIKTWVITGKQQRSTAVRAGTCPKTKNVSSNELSAMQSAEHSVFTKRRVYLSKMAPFNA